MENKHIGFLITGIGVVMAIMVLMFDKVLKDTIRATCSMGASCGMYSNANLQTWMSLSIVLIIFIIGFTIMFTKPREKIVIKKIKQKKKRLNLSNLEKDEKEVVKLLQHQGGTMFQADLMEKMEIGKVKTTRLLDKLESKQIINRIRRGMNNVVALRNS
jgi:uncharacterized membrane protein